MRSLIPLLILLVPLPVLGQDAQAPSSTGEQATPQTVQAEFRFIREEGDPPFSGVSTTPGMLTIAVNVAGARSAGVIDLSTSRSLVDLGRVRQQGVQISETGDTVAWRGRTYPRSRAHSVEVTLEGQVAMVSDLSAIELSPPMDGAPGPLSFVLGRGVVDNFALTLALGKDQRFYGLTPTGGWAMQSEDAVFADFAYEGGVITAEINGTPARLFIDLTSRRGIELLPEGWSKVFGTNAQAPANFTVGPFTRTTEPVLTFAEPPVENIDGVVGLGFLEGYAIVLDGPAKMARMMGSAAETDGADTAP